MGIGVLILGISFYSRLLKISCIMSKFLFVSSFDLRRNTSGNIRIVSLMKSLHDKGHIVHCLFVPSNHVSDKKIYEGLMSVDRLITFPKTEIKPVEKCESIGTKKKSLLSHIRSWAVNLYTKYTVYDVYQLSLMKLTEGDLNELDDSYDYVISSSEPRSSHKFAKKVIRIKKYNTKWILYWGDPMSNDVASTKLFSWREANEEKRLISISDFSLYTNPCAVNYMKRKYPELASKINWIPTTDYNISLYEKEHGDINKIGYFGDYNTKFRNISPFYESCCENSFNTVIIGSSDAPLVSTSTVKVYGRMSREEVNAKEKDCGILIVLENISKTGECIQVPGKLYHYGLSYKYILVITESVNISKEYECYNRFVFVPNEKGKITEAIYNIQSGKYSNINIKPVEDFRYETIPGLLMDIIM